MQKISKMDQDVFDDHQSEKGVYFATSNLGKLREVENILNCPVYQVTLSLIEIQSLDVWDVVARKAKDAYSHAEKPVLVEDTGLYLSAWNGLPGALIAWFLKTMGTDGVCTMMSAYEDRRAIARTILGFYDGSRFHGFLGEIVGCIVSQPRGDYGFGWDSIFQPNGANKTFGEMNINEKNLVSMRRIAVNNFKKQINLYYNCSG
jgi:non-canonical purine NTP pyrophosphatase (RdgB/HAM1 family)